MYLVLVWSIPRNVNTKKELRSIYTCNNSRPWVLFQILSMCKQNSLFFWLSTAYQQFFLLPVTNDIHFLDILYLDVFTSYAFIKLPWLWLFKQKLTNYKQTWWYLMLMMLPFPRKEITRSRHVSMPCMLKWRNAIVQVQKSKHVVTLYPNSNQEAIVSCFPKHT